MPNKKTAVVILNYNGEKFLRQFLPLVIQYTKNAEIIVADNASTDHSLQLLLHEFPSVRIIPLKENTGFCGGYNRALKYVETEYYVLLNSDVEVTPGWLEPLEKLLDGNPKIAVAQPKIKSFRQKDFFEYAGAAGGFIDSLGYPFCRGRLFDTVEEDTGQYNDEREIFWATGACMIIRSRVFHEVGGFDEDFFAHMEEIDLCWRVKQSGHLIFYTWKSTVYHVGGGTLSKLNPQKTFLNFRNSLYFIFKNFSSRELCWKLLLRLLLDYVAALKFLMEGNGKHSIAVFQAHGAFIKNGNTLYIKRKALRKYPSYNGTKIYKGLIVLDYFVRRKKRITV